MDSKSHKVIYLLLTLVLISCGNSDEEADYNYKNAMEHYNKINKNAEKRKDALYFFNLAVKSDKYKTVSIAKHIYTLAAEILIADNNLTIDDKYKLTDDIINGVEILISKIDNFKEADKKELIEEADKIINSDDNVYILMRKILIEKSSENLNKLKLLIHK